MKISDGAVDVTDGLECAVRSMQGIGKVRINAMVDSIHITHRLWNENK